MQVFSIGGRERKSQGLRCNATIVKPLSMQIISILASFSSPKAHNRVSYSCYKGEIGSLQAALFYVDP